MHFMFSLPVSLAAMYTHTRVWVHTCVCVCACVWEKGGGWLYGESCHTVYIKFLIYLSIQKLFLVALLLLLLITLITKGQEDYSFSFISYMMLWVEPERLLNLKKKN